jgi:hypothetical protein
MVPSPPKQKARISQIPHTINLELNMPKRSAEVSMTTDAMPETARLDTVNQFGPFAAAL